MAKLSIVARWRRRTELYQDLAVRGRGRRQSDVETRPKGLPDSQLDLGRRTIDPVSEDLRRSGQRRAKRDVDRRRLAPGGNAGPLPPGDLFPAVIQLEPRQVLAHSNVSRRIGIGIVGLVVCPG